MSMDLLKERFSVYHPTKDDLTLNFEDEIEKKENIILNLEQEGNNLANQVVTLEHQKNNLLQELNKARHFEEGVFSTKRKEHINEIQSKENIIKEIKTEFSPLHKKIDKQKVELSYRDDIVKKYSNINKELNEKINKLNYKVNYQQKNSKKIISEIKSERKTTYQDYINNLDAYENALTSKNGIINNYKTKLKESLDKLKETNDLIFDLKKNIKINENVREQLTEKKEHILNLNEKIDSLSKEVKHLSSLSYENSILESKLQKSENFEHLVNSLRVDEYKDEIKFKDDIIDEKRQELLESIKQLNNLSAKIDSSQSKNKQDEETIKNLKSNVKENKNSFISQTDDFKNIIDKKDNYIMKLKNESEKLSEKVIVLSGLARENHILQNKLQTAESFQNIVVSKKDKFEKDIKETNHLNGLKLVNLLTDVSRKKQGNEKLTWNKWLNIPENNYLLNLDETVAKKIFNESNYLVQEAINAINRQESIEDGTITGNIRGPRVTKIHYGLEFDGLKQSLNTTFSDGVNAPTDRTYSWWMKSDVADAKYKGVFGYGLVASEAFHLNYDGAKKYPLLYLSVGGSDRRFAYFNDTPAQDDGNWHHWMLFSDVDDATGAKLYVDGVDIGIYTSTDDGTDSDLHNQPLTIGAFDISTTTNEHFEGSITNFAVFSVDITDRAVSHYNNGIPKDLSGESNLVGYWKMDENTGTTAADSSGNGNDGEFDGDQPTWITVMKASDAYIGGIQQKG